MPESSEVIPTQEVPAAPETADTSDNTVVEVLTEMPIEEDALYILQLFGQMDEASPLMRLIVAAVIVAVSLVLLVATRLYIRFRIKRMEAVPADKFRPLRWQAQGPGRG